TDNPCRPIRDRNATPPASKNADPNTSRSWPPVCMVPVSWRAMTILATTSSGKYSTSAQRQLNCDATHPAYKGARSEMNTQITLKPASTPRRQLGGIAVTIAASDTVANAPLASPEPARPRMKMPTLGAIALTTPLATLTH